MLALSHVSEGDKKRKVSKRRHHTSSRTKKSTVTRTVNRNGGHRSLKTKTKNKGAKSKFNHHTREAYKTGGKAELRTSDNFLKRKEHGMNSKTYGKEELKTGGGFIKQKENGFLKRKEHGKDYANHYVDRAASLINANKDMTATLNGLNYVDSNEDYGNGKNLMIGAGFNSKLKKKAETAGSDSNERPDIEQKTYKRKVSSEKPDSEAGTDKKKVVIQREDFDEVFHKTESTDKDGDGKKVSDFVEIYHETETKEKDKGKKQTVSNTVDDKKSVKSENEKKSDDFNEVYHTTPGICSKHLCFLRIKFLINLLSAKNFTKSFCWPKCLINLSLASSTSFFTTQALCPPG